MGGFRLTGSSHLRLSSGQRSAIFARFMAAIPFFFGPLIEPIGMPQNISKLFWPLSYCALANSTIRDLKPSVNFSSSITFYDSIPYLNNSTKIQ